MSKKYKTTLFQKLFLLLFSVLLSCLIGELIVRWVYSDTMVLFPRYHVANNYGKFEIRGIKPNMNFVHKSPEGEFEFHTNNRGFRNYTDIDYSNDLQKLRILGVGDSHVQGYEVNQNQTFCFLLEEKLNSMGINSEVINTGVSGFSTAEEYAFFANEGIKYDPSFLILGFFENDLDDNLKAGLFTLKGDSLVIQSYKHLPGVKIQKYLNSNFLTTWLSENSYLYSFFFNTIWDISKAILTDKSKRNTEEYAIASRKELNKYQIKLTRILLSKIYGEAKKNDIKLILVDIPSRYIGSNVHSSFAKLKVTNPLEYCDYFISFQSLVKKIPQDSLNRNKGHYHISPQTHELIAQTAFEYILREISSSK